MVGRTSDYTQAIKEYVPKGQKQTLWEEFFTGAHQTYQGLTQQTQDITAYDISQAYANYKQQQLQLQMNERLGAGFKEQIGSQLRSEYGTAYQNIMAKEESSLAQIENQYKSTLQEGSEQFAQMGEQLRNYDKLIHEWAELTQVAMPENMTRSYTTETGENVTELTDYGKLWYSDVLGSKTTEGMTFEQWLESEEFGSEDVNFKTREALLESYEKNPELFRYNVTGLTPDFNAEETRSRLIGEEKDAVVTDIAKLSSDANALSTIYGENLQSLSLVQTQELQKNIIRNNEYVSTLSNTTGWIDTVVKDKFGNSWTLISYNESYNENRFGGNKAKNLGVELGVIDSKGYVQKSSKYKEGDVIKHEGHYYVITTLNDKAFGYRTVSPGDFNYEGATKRLF